MIDLKIKSIEADSRRFTVEGPDGFVVHVFDPLPASLDVGDTLCIDDALWRQWQAYWAEGPPNLTAEWCEMNELKERTFDKRVWIPIYADQIISEIGEFGYAGYSEDYFDAHSLIVPNNQKAKAMEFDWIERGSDDRPCIDEDETFHPASEYNWNDTKGWLPVLVQYTAVEKRRDIQVNQDIILALGLKRVGNMWVRPEEDNVEVIKLTQSDNSTTVRVEMRADFLKDYMCATNSGLVLFTYQSRKAIREHFNKLERNNDKREGPSSSYEWEGSIREVFEGNSLLDILGGATVSRGWRTDTDYDEDIPVYKLPGATASETFEVKSQNRKVCQAVGELWKKEWIEPAATSPRVRGDKAASQLEFIIDNEGHRETSATLTSPSRWLWFHPDVVNDLLKKPHAVLKWHSEDTGHVGGAWNRSVHFGVNAIGLVNVYAKDIALLPEIDKKTWANHNVSPDGKVSTELLMSQMQSNPAATVAPETLFFRLIDEIQGVSKARLGRELLRHHSSSERISTKIHRFETATLDGFYSLCKEITRFLIERIDEDLLKELKNETDKNVRSLKRLERILLALGHDGTRLLGILVGVYDLRHADAHLPSSSKIKDAMVLARIDYDELRFNAGKRLLQNINATLIQIKDALETSDLTKLDSK